MRATVYAFQHAFPFLSKTRGKERKREEKRKKNETATKEEREREKGSRGWGRGGDTRVSKDVMRERNGENEMRCERGRERKSENAN